MGKTIFSKFKTILFYFILFYPTYYPLTIPSPKKHTTRVLALSKFVNRTGRFFSLTELSWILKLLFINMGIFQCFFYLNFTTISMGNKAI